MDNSNKVLVKILLPEIDQSYYMYLPINRKVGNVVELINKLLDELTNGAYKGSIHQCLYDEFTGNIYENNKLIIDTNIRNGSHLVLI